MSLVEDLYRAHVDSLSHCEKFQRVENLLQWTREVIARRVHVELGDMDDERLRWEVAMRMYGSDRRFRKLLERRRPHVSG